jgi:hypothetical protein
MDLIECPHCGTRVFASVDGECPACRKGLSAPAKKIIGDQDWEEFGPPRSVVELVTVARFGDALEASMAKNCLEDAGIGAYLADSETATMAWQLTGALGGVKLQVAGPDLDRARVVLDEQLAASPEEAEGLAEEALAATPEVAEEGESSLTGDLDPDEPELKPTEREEDAERAFRGAIFGLLFLPLQFYVTYLLLLVVTSRETLSGRARRRALIAAAINIPFVLLFCVLGGTILGSR